MILVRQPKTFWISIGYRFLNKISHKNTIRIGEFVAKNLKVVPFKGSAWHLRRYRTYIFPSRLQHRLSS